jgi:hypothetical protein
MAATRYLASFCLLLALSASPAFAGNIDEFVTFRFNDGSSYAEQVAVMHKLDGVISPLDGFVSREYFYDRADQQWLDHLVWASLEAADASQKLLQQPDIAAIFNRFSGAVITRYERVK